jgi:nucleoid-associated protein YejK
MFVLNRVVIHEVIKLDNTTIATVDLSERLSEITDGVFRSLVERINDTFGTTPTLKNSHFDEHADTVFSTFLKEYVGESTDDRFYIFSVQSIESLRALIERQQWATGGFYCFADYDDNGRHCVAVILLRRKDSFNFTKTAGTFRAQGAETINYDKIAMGFRLNVQVYQDEEDQRNYIALIASQHDQLSSYFKEWVSVTGIISKEKNTRALVSLVRLLSMPVGEDGNDTYPSADVFHKAVYDYVEESHQKKVSLTEMATHFYGQNNERQILDLAVQHQIDIDNEFVRDARTWKRVIAVRAQIPGVKLSVDFEKINEGVVTLQGDRVVIQSQELVNQIRNQQNG